MARLVPNPGQPIWATVLTPHGIRELSAVVAGTQVWDGYAWTEVTRVASLGLKNVTAYGSSAGVFYGLDDHCIAQDGAFHKVGSAYRMDLAVGPMCEPRSDFDSQLVMDGLVLGDGQAHQPGPVLEITKRDGDYFVSPVAHLIGAQVPKRQAWFVTTNVANIDVPAESVRSVPLRYRSLEPSKMQAVLRGLASANGSVSAPGSLAIQPSRGVRKASGDSWVTVYKTTSLRAAQQIAEMVSSLGFIPEITEQRFDLRRKRPKWDASGARSHSFVKIKHDVPSFGSRIGFLHSRKMHDLSNLRRSSAQPELSPPIQSRVPIFRPEACVAIEVESKRHTYWSGGLLVGDMTAVWVTKGSKKAMATP